MHLASITDTYDNNNNNTIIVIKRSIPITTNITTKTACAHHLSMYCCCIRPQLGTRDTMISWNNITGPNAFTFF